MLISINHCLYESTVSSAVQSRWPCHPAIIILYCIWYGPWCHMLQACDDLCACWLSPIYHTPYNSHAVFLLKSYRSFSIYLSLFENIAYNGFRNYAAWIHHNLPQNKSVLQVTLQINCAVKCECTDGQNSVIHTPLFVTRWWLIKRPVSIRRV